MPGQLTRRQIIIWSLVGTAILELITVIMRFGFKLESTRDGASTIGVLTMGFRVHHGYIGLAMIAVCFALHRSGRPMPGWMLVAGVALFLSDMVHHFLVLWPIVGSPEFHFWY